MPELLKRAVDHQLGKIIGNYCGEQEREAREEARKFAIPIHLDCAGLIGEKEEYASLNLHDERNTSLELNGKQWIRMSMSLRDKEVDLVIRRWADNPDNVNPLKRSRVVEEYSFRRVYYDDCCVTKRTLLSSSETVEGVKRGELEKLMREIRGSDDYKKMMEKDMQLRILLGSLVK